MENKNVGFLIIGISAVMALIAYLFNTGMKNIVSQSCTHGNLCPMYGTITTQTYLSIAIIAIIFFIGLFIMLSKPKEKVVIKKIKEKRKKLNIEGLDKKEKIVIETLINEKGAMFQASLMEKLGIGKVGLTRLLDKLEAKQLIERKRRGMNNIIVLKQ